MKDTFTISLSNDQVRDAVRIYAISLLPGKLSARPVEDTVVKWNEDDTGAMVHFTWKGENGDSKSTQVWVLTYKHKHGTDVALFSTAEKAYDAESQIVDANREAFDLGDDYIEITQAQVNNDISLLL